MLQSHQESEWSPIRGLASAIGPLALKSCACLAALALILILAQPAISWVAKTGSFGILGLAGIIIVVVAVFALPAWLCGSLLSHKLIERIGFEGIIPAALGAFCLWIAVLSASAIAELITQTSTWLNTLIALAIGLEATLVIAWRTWFDPD